MHKPLHVMNYEIREWFGDKAKRGWGWRHANTVQMGRHDVLHIQRYKTLCTDVCRLSKNVQTDKPLRKQSFSIKARQPEARVSASRRVGPKPASQHQGASARSPRLSVKARRPEARVSATRRVGPKPASQHQDALARRPRLGCNYPQ